MADQDESETGTARKISKLAVAVSLVVSISGGAGGFYMVYSGHALPGFPSLAFEHGKSKSGALSASLEMPEVSFLPVDPLIISLGEGGQNGHLRFKAQLEVSRSHKSEVEMLMPRVVDVLNSYLRALEINDLTDSAALVRLRSQMLRRIQIVTGSGRVNDLLIMEFVLN